MVKVLFKIMKPLSLVGPKAHPPQHDFLIPIDYCNGFHNEQSQVITLGFK